MAAKKQHEVDFINKKRTQSKSTIMSPPISDSTIETSTIPEVKKKSNVEVDDFDDRDLQKYRAKKRSLKSLVVNQEKKNNNVEVDPKRLDL